MVESCVNLIKVVLVLGENVGWQVGPYLVCSNTGITPLPCPKSTGNRLPHPNSIISYLVCSNTGTHSLYPHRSLLHMDCSYTRRLRYRNVLPSCLAGRYTGTHARHSLVVYQGMWNLLSIGLNGNRRIPHNGDQCSLRNNDRWNQPVRKKTKWRQSEHTDQNDELSNHWFFSEPTLLKRDFHRV